MALTVQINNLVESLPNVNIYQPIIECIVNSLEAKASNVTVKICSVEDTEMTFDGSRIVDKIVIGDNGDGFTTENFEAFKEYRTKNKIHLGCKGVGRLTWLKIFKKAEVLSIVREDGKVSEKKFVFNENFDFNSKLDGVSVPKGTRKKTTITMSESSEAIRCDSAFIKSIREHVFIDLLPKLILLDKEFSIVFEYDRAGVEIQSIKSVDLPVLQEEIFTVATESQDKEFVLKYILSDGDDISLSSKTYAYYCANSRAVEAFKTKGLSVNLMEGESQYALFLLESSVFDEKVNDSRNKIELSGANHDMFNPITWDEVNEHLRPVLEKIIYDRWPQLKQVGEQEKKRLAEANPHLSTYINKLHGVGHIEEKEALKIAEKNFNEAKKQVRKKYKDLLNKHKVGDQDIKDFNEFNESTTEVSKQELAEYVWYRKIIIDVMDKLVGRKEQQESVIHNLIMPIKAKDIEQIEDNNLWILDDRFSLYKYAASEIEIDKICKDVCGENVSESDYNDGDDRPDLTIFYSDSMSSEDDLEAVIFEFKNFSANKYQRGKGLDQLPLYADSFGRRNPKFKRFWVYLIVDKIDEEFCRLLSVSRNYKKFFSHNGEMFLQYNEANSVYISVLTMESLVANARARNHRFLEIIQSTKCSEVEGEMPRS